MKIWIASAGALLLISACSASKDATAALEAMNLGTGTSSPMLKYEDKSGSGDKITLKNVTLGPEGTALKAGTLTLAGLDMNEGGKPTLTSLALNNITLATAPADGSKFNLKAITIDGVNPVLGEYLAAQFKEGASGELPPLEQLGFSKISVNGLTYSMDGAAMGQPGKINIALGEFSISDLKNQIFGGAHLAGLKGDFDVPDMAKGTFDFGTADIKNIRGDVYAKAVEAGMTTMMGGTVDPMAGITSPLEAGYDEFHWSGMNIDASGVKFIVSKVEQKLERNAQGVVTALRMPKATITFTAESSAGTLGAQAIAGLNALGYPKKTIELYGGGDATYDPATDTTRYVDYAFGLTDGLDIKLTGGFRGLTKAMSALFTAAETMGGAGGAPDPFADPSEPKPAMPEPDMSGFEALKLVDFDLTMTDKSLMKFLLSLGANPMFGGTGDAEALRADIVNQVMAVSAEGLPGVDKAVSNEFAAAVSAFVKQSGTLNIKMKPTEPLGIAGTGAPATKSSLGFSATFTPSPAAPN